MKAYSDRSSYIFIIHILAFDCSFMHTFFIIPILGKVKNYFRVDHKNKHTYKSFSTVSISEGKKQEIIVIKSQNHRMLWVGRDL